MSQDKGIFEPDEGFASAPPPKSPFEVDESSPDPFASVPPAPSPFGAAEGVPVQRRLPETLKPATHFADKFEAENQSSPFQYRPSSDQADDEDGMDAAADNQVSPPVDDSDLAEALPEMQEDDEFGNQETPPKLPARQDSPSKPPLVSTPPPTISPSNSESKGLPDESPSDESDSSSIRQIELRAIFGVDRELTAKEMLQRAGGLTGITHVARVNSNDVGAVDSIRRVMANLGFGDEKVQIISGETPVTFIRESGVVLAVKSKGEFAAGVRETLIIVARELGRM